MITTEKCAHGVCGCMKPYSAQTRATSTARLDPEAPYCSRRCEEQAGRGALGDDACECGHPECEAGASAGIPPMM